MRKILVLSVVIIVLLAPSLPAVHACCDAGCVRTPGYWKNHADLWAEHNNDPFFTSSQTWLEVLSTKGKEGNAYYILARHYLAARLNVMYNGAFLSAELAYRFALAEEWFNTHTPGDTKGEGFWEYLKDSLESYNTGGWDVPPCE